MAGYVALLMSWQEVKAYTWQNVKSRYTWGDLVSMLSTMQAEIVGVGAAMATGAIWVAPKGTPLPKDAKAKIPSTFTLLGFTSDAGLQIAESATTDFIHAWEERTMIMGLRTEYTESISFMPIQCNQDALAIVWGASNVTLVNGELVTRHSGTILDPVCIVIETVPREGIVKRFVGTFQPVERGEQTLDGTQVDGRQLTFNAVADANGVTMTEFTAFATAMNSA